MFYKTSPKLVKILLINSLSFVSGESLILFTDVPLLDIIFARLVRVGFQSVAKFHTLI